MYIYIYTIYQEWAGSHVIKCAWKPATGRSSLRMDAFCTCVYTYSLQLSSFRMPTLWFIYLIVGTCHFNTLFWVYLFFFQEKKDSTLNLPSLYDKKVATGGFYRYTTCERASLKATYCSMYATYCSIEWLQHSSNFPPSGHGCHVSRIETGACHTSHVHVSCLSVINLIWQFGQQYKGNRPKVSFWAVLI